MGRIATGVVCAGALSFLGVFVGAAGCAAGSDTGDVPTQDANPTDPGSSSKVPPSSSSSSSSGGAGDDDDAPQGDGGVHPHDGGTKGDAGPVIPVDAGPPPPPAPNPGDTCTTRDQVFTKACGFCGTQQAVCAQNDDGSLAWSSYSDCAGMHGVCAAGSTATQDCNNCGSRQVTCSSSCTWQAAACSAPANTGCVPGSWDITTAGCGQGDPPYRVRSCTAACTYNPYSGCEGPPTTIEVGPTVGSVSSTIAILGGQLAKIASYKCPVTSISSMLTAYAYTQVHNGLAKDVTVDIYNSAAPGGTVDDTAIVAYNSDVAPTTDAARKACLQAATEGTSSLTGNYDLASLDGSKVVTIPAGATFIVYTTAEQNDATSVGGVKVNVKLETIAP